jgi:hypothetical protein
VRDNGDGNPDYNQYVYYQWVDCSGFWGVLSITWCGHIDGPGSAWEQFGENFDACYTGFCVGHGQRITVSYNGDISVDTW